LVSLAVLSLRRTQPDRRRAFRVPFSPVLPVLSILCCLLLMAGLTLENWIRFFVWLAIGLVIYFAYSRKRSTLGAAHGANA
jgi:APA family basic amino acid/polyamine antiporter